jgi:hypothetical protein
VIYRGDLLPTVAYDGAVPVVFRHRSFCFFCDDCA